MQCSFFILQQYMGKGFDALGTSTRARGNTSYNNSAAVPSGNYRGALTRPRPLPASPPSPSANTSAQVATQRRKQRELHGGAQPAEGTAHAITVHCARHRCTRTTLSLPNSGVPPAFPSAPFQWHPLRPSQSRCYHTCSSISRAQTTTPRNRHEAAPLCHPTGEWHKATLLGNEPEKTAHEE